MFSADQRCESDGRHRRLAVRGFAIVQSVVRWQRIGLPQARFFACHSRRTRGSEGVRVQAIHAHLTLPRRCSCSTDTRVRAFESFFLRGWRVGGSGADGSRSRKAVCRRMPAAEGRRERKDRPVTRTYGRNKVRAEAVETERPNSSKTRKSGESYHHRRHYLHRHPQLLHQQVFLLLLPRRRRVDGDRKGKGTRPLASGVTSGRLDCFGAHRNEGF